MNHLFENEIPRNRYFALRHGHSLANEQGIIVSHPENGCEQFGLSELGRLQVRDCLQVCRFDANTIIVSSDFRRARETAEIVHELLSCNVPLQLEQRMRERNFGDLELTSDCGYSEIWREDAIDANRQPRAVESVNQVMARVTSVVRECEDRYTDTILLLVSHGDALQILQAAFAGLDGSLHRQLEHLNTAEVRELVAGKGS